MSSEAYMCGAYELTVLPALLDRQVPSSVKHWTLNYPDHYPGLEWCFLWSLLTLMGNINI